MLLTIKAAKAAQAPETEKVQMEFAPIRWAIGADGIAYATQSSNATNNAGLKVTNLPENWTDEDGKIVRPIELAYTIKTPANANNANASTLISTYQGSGVSLSKLEHKYTLGAIYGGEYFQLTPTSKGTANVYNYEFNTWYTCIYSFDPNTYMHTTKLIKTETNELMYSDEIKVVTDKYCVEGLYLMFDRAGFGAYISEFKVDTAACWFRIG